eukprot:6213989-Pleurochrysis_carterae.AAC.4
MIAYESVRAWTYVNNIPIDVRATSRQLTSYSEYVQATKSQGGELAQESDQTAPHDAGTYLPSPLRLSTAVDYRLQVDA